MSESDGRDFVSSSMSEGATPGVALGSSFGTGTPGKGGLPVAIWGAAAAVILVAVGAVLAASHKKPVAVANTLQPPAAYAPMLPMSGLAMSESENLSGGKLTYLDGRVKNAGSQRVAGVTVQVVFANDEALPPQIDTLPVTLVRMREPYIDTEPVSADPLRPGDEREFRLIFERVPTNWNSQLPEVRVIGTSLR